MEQELLSESVMGPKTTIKSVSERVDALEELIAKMAHYSGTSSALLLEYGIKPWVPSRQDRSKVKGVSN